MNLSPVDVRTLAFCEALLEELEEDFPELAEASPAAEVSIVSSGLSSLAELAALPKRRHGGDHCGSNKRCDEAPTEGAASREKQAHDLATSGGLRPQAVEPPPTKKECDELAARIAAADDDAAVRIANDPRALAIATPEQKAALVRKLMDGHTNGDEEQAIKKILLSCSSREELDRVAGLSGGWDEIADELDAGDMNQVAAFGQSLSSRQEQAALSAVDLLEQVATPEEFARLYEELGGDQLKHKLPSPPKPELMKRLEALGEKNGVAGVGYGVAPEKAAGLQSAIRQAIAKGDNDAIVQLSENSEAMKVASPAEKARMIKILQEGWTKDRQDMAIARILTSCGSKAEFDQVVDMAGGREILKDIDFPEAKADINKLMGGFDRLDCADDRATAEAYRGVLMPPKVDELSATREPRPDELGAVLGDPPPGHEGDERVDAVRNEMGRRAHDVQGDPLARNKLALVNRDREIHGQPPIDHTSLVTEAYKLANDPAFTAEVNRAIAAAGATDPEDQQEIREKLLAQRLGGLAKANGLSEQDMKTLVTSKMGRVMQEGAAAVRSLGGSDPAMSAWADRLQSTGQAAANLFKVPPSFVEDFVSVLSIVTDALAAVVNVIPGVGQAISGAYFGVKAIVGLVQGDIFGAFKNVLSAIPGVSGLFGAAGAVIATGAKVVQAGVAAGEGIVNGNPLAVVGAVGSVAGQFGFDPMKAISSELKQVGGPLVGKIDELANSPAAQAFAQHAVPVGRLVGAIGSGDVGQIGQALGQWVPMLGSNPLSDALSGLGEQAGRILESPEVAAALRIATKARGVLEQIAALQGNAGDVRRFEDAALKLAASGADWTSIAEELLRRAR